MDPYRHSKVVPRDPLSEECLGQLEEWIKTCDESHKLCRNVEVPSLPTRVIDVGSRDGSTKPFLLVSEGKRARYITLSHCWRPSAPPLQTTRANLASRVKGIEWCGLPKSFQDTIKLARILEVQYVWIDSLCILQGDIHDWTLTSSQMGSVYKDAYLTISATSAAGSNCGFLNIRPSANVIQVDTGEEGGLPYSMWVRPAISHAPFLGAAFQEDQPSPDFATLTRAWCFQERLLSHRVVHFTSSEMVFECREGSSCECGFFEQKRFTYKSENHHFLTDARGYPVEDLWMDWTKIYTACALTYRRDVLPALSGIAQSISHLPMGDYLAGLWSGSLIKLLMWRSVKVEECRRLPDIYTAPTWSWASRVGPIWYPSVTGYTIEIGTTHATILEAVCYPSSQDDVYGSVSRGHLQLKGFIFPTVLKFGPRFHPGRRQGGPDIYFGAERPTGFRNLFEDNFRRVDEDGLSEPLIEIDTIDDLKGMTSRSEIFLLPIASWKTNQEGGGEFCLVLRRCEDARTFRRIGISLWGAYGMDFGGMTQKAIVII
jgi:hypothetical protein